MSLETLMRSIRISRRSTSGGWFPCQWTDVSALRHPVTFVRLHRFRLDNDGLGAL